MDYYLNKTLSQKLEIHMANGVTDIVICKSANYTNIYEFLEHLFNTQKNFSFSLNKEWFLKIGRGIHEKQNNRR